MDEQLGGLRVSVQKTGDKYIEISLSPPEEIMAMVYCQEDMMKTLTPLIKALKQSNGKLTFGNSFEDFLVYKDKPVTEVFAGYKAFFELVMAAKCKNLLLDALPSKSKKQVQVLIELAKLFAGADVNNVMSFHPKNLADLVKTNDFVSTMLTPTDLRAAAAGMIPLEDMGLPVAMMKPYIEAGYEMLEKLESIESISVANVDLPVEFAANGLPATVGVTLNCSNVKPFSLMYYLAEPAITRIKEFQDDE